MRRNGLPTSGNREEIKGEIRMKREMIERIRGCTYGVSIEAESFIEQLRDLMELHGLYTETLVSANCEPVTNGEETGREPTKKKGKCV